MLWVWVSHELIVLKAAQRRHPFQVLECRRSGCEGLLPADLLPAVVERLHGLRDTACGRAFQEGGSTPYQYTPLLWSAPPSSQQGMPGSRAPAV